jgi:hypothetical protein
MAGEGVRLLQTSSSAVSRVQYEMSTFRAQRGIEGLLYGLGSNHRTTSKDVFLASNMLQSISKAPLNTAPTPISGRASPISVDPVPATPVLKSTYPPCPP